MPESSSRGTGCVVIPCRAAPPVSARTAASRTRLPREPPPLRSSPVPAPASCGRAFMVGSSCPRALPAPRRSAGRRRCLLGGRLLAEVLAQLVQQRACLPVLRRHLHQGGELRLRLGEPALLGQGVAEVEAG